jgi:competence protein ComEC
MSVFATGAIVLVAPSWADRLSRRLPRAVALAVAVPAAAQLACTPVLVGSFGQLTPYAVLANLLAAPAVAPATLAGIAAAVVAPVLPGGAALLTWLAALPAWWLSVVARTLARAPLAGVAWPSGFRGLALLALTGVTVWVGVVVVRRARRARPGVVRP